MDMRSRFHELWYLIGNSPIIVVKFRYKGEIRRVYAKCEQYSITGSIKDRMALHVLEKAYQTGAIKPGDVIVEATSGNTGISFAAIGKALGHQVRIVMPSWMSVERMQIIGSYGANIITVTKDEGGFLGSIAKTKEMAANEPNIFLPCQFENEVNVITHFNTTAPELWWQLRYNDISPDAFVAGVGTGGTVMGVGRFLKMKNSKIKVHPMEPEESPTIKTGVKVGHHRIQGISDEFIPPIVKLAELDEVIDVSDGDAILMAQKLASELGLAVGISSGANLLAAIKVQDMMHKDAIVITVFSDDNKKYLSTDLMREETIKENYMSPMIELLEYNVFKRVCKTCCDPFLCNQKVKMTD
ncbi:MAG: PLP-dependent cysteine synthase family protein [Candidatus Cloacimonetes bacterium]|nr:PLP-dependent cysteine synthase family protein [Candidatus Cloacimonadota bacterium]